MIHSLLGLIHVIAAGATLLIGLAIFLRRKGGTVHRVLGYLYAVSMLTMLVSALCIYELTRSFNLLHGFAILSTLQLARGLFHAITRKPKATWLASHYLWITYSYIGLCAALVAESATRIVMPYLHEHHGVKSFGWFWALVGIATFVVVGTGDHLVKRNRQILKSLDSPLTDG